jgi:hypothetical protein
VYRCFDASGRLLYVGCSGNVTRRLGSHHSKPWWPLVAQVTVSDPMVKDILSALTAALRRAEVRHVGGIAEADTPAAADELLTAIWPLIERRKGPRARRRKWATMMQMMRPADASDVTPNGAGPNIDPGDVTTGVTSTRRQNYSDAVAIQAEGLRVGIVTCLRCGSAVLLSDVTDSLSLHDEWHVTLGRDLLAGLL